MPAVRPRVATVGGIGQTVWRWAVNRRLVKPLGAFALRSFAVLAAWLYNHCGPNREPMSARIGSPTVS
jgi:hypothetical protein